MKKTYITPAVKVVKLGTERLIALSGVYSEYNTGIGYGGIDMGGTVNPSVKQNNGLLDNIW